FRITKEPRPYRGGDFARLDVKQVCSTTSHSLGQRACEAVRPVVEFIRWKVFRHREAVVQANLKNVGAELVREIFVWIPERLCAGPIEWCPVRALLFLLLIPWVLEQLGVTAAAAEKTKLPALVYNEHPALLRILPSPACLRDIGRVDQERRFV